VITTMRNPGPRRAFTAQALLYIAAGASVTAAHAVLFLLLRGALGPFAANVVAISVTATANVEFHHRVTFRSRRSERGRRLVAVVATVFYDATYSSSALLLLAAFVVDPTATQQTAVIVLAAVAGGIARFLLLRGWVFRATARS